MQKIIVFLSIFLLTGCNSGEKVICDNNGNEEIYTLKDGIIESLTIDGEKQSQATVNELNGTYFTSTVTNDEAKTVLEGYISSIGGSCR